MNLIEELLKENKSFTKEANKKKVEGFEEKVNKIDRIISKIRKEFSNYPRAIEEVEYDSEPAGFRITDRVHEDEIKDYIENNFSDKDLRYIDSGDYYRVRFESFSSKKKVTKEDTVKKSNGKWTNRGDDGTEHGEFDTKKKADDQRKAMYANGFKGESVKKLKEDYDDDQAYEQFMSDMKSYPGFVEVSKICQDYGYILYRLIRSKYDIDIIIRSTDKYHAGIYRQHKFSRNTYEFEAQTTAYGSLGYEEYRKFKDAVDDTYELLMNLNSIDFDSLDIIKIEDE